MWKTVKFYSLMNYPTPKNSDIYTYINENISSNNIWISKTKEEEESFSWDKKCELMDEYIDYINEWSWIWKYIPCIRQVYLCNSITFNALHNNSDIDLCIITRSKYLRFARAFSWLATTLIGIKRQKGKYNNNRKKICLSFYIDESHSDIYHLRKRQWDIYLSYWLAHTVLLYSDSTLQDNHILYQNKRLLSYLPHHPYKQSIKLEHSIIKGNSFIKKIIELIFCNKIGRIIQSILWWIRWTHILWYKKQQLSNYNKKEIIITPNMLKFHEDKRNIVQHKRKTATKKRYQDDNHNIAD
jgi:hypothetical protein